MPATKVYTSMSTGVVDGALMGTGSLLIFKLIEPTKYVTMGLPEMPTTLFMVMNEQAYKELSDKNRKILDKLTGLGISLRAAQLEANFGNLGMKKFRALPGKPHGSVRPSLGWRERSAHAQMSRVDDQVGIRRTGPTAEAQRCQCSGCQVAWSRLVSGWVSSGLRSGPPFKQCPLPRKKLTRCWVSNTPKSQTDR